MKRLMRIIQQFDNKPDQLLVDIGSDHGFLAIEAIQQKKITHAFCVEKSHKPFVNCQMNVDKRKVNNHINCIISNGFQNFDCRKEIDYLTISGIGSKNCVEILEGLKKNVFSNLIILPHDNPCTFRKFAIQKKWLFYYEDFVEYKGLIYQLIHINKNIGIKLENDFDAVFGLNILNQNNPLFYKYWKREYFKFKKIPANRLNNFQKVVIQKLTNWFQS